MPPVDSQVRLLDEYCYHYTIFIIIITIIINPINIITITITIKIFSDLFTHEMIFTKKLHDLHFANNPPLNNHHHHHRHHKMQMYLIFSMGQSSRDEKKNNGKNRILYYNFTYVYVMDDVGVHFLVVKLCDKFDKKH